MTELDREKFVLGDASAHVDFLNCERISERSHIHGWSVDAHYHEGLSQLFVFGEGHVEARIDYAPARIDGPALVWLPALCSHAFDYTKGMAGWVITVPIADVGRLAAGRLWLARWIEHPQVLCGAEHGAAIEEGLRLATDIEVEHARQGEEKNAVLEARFFLLLVALHRGLMRGAGGAVTDRRHDLVMRFQGLLDLHLGETRAVSDYADMLSVTTTHLSRSLKSLAGRTAGQMIQDRVMLEAKRQLVFTDKPVAEIAYRLRFSSPSYFARFFLGRARETPRAFRERMRRARRGA